MYASIVLALHSENVRTWKCFDSASTARRMYSQRPWIPGIRTSGGRSESVAINFGCRHQLFPIRCGISVPQRLTRFERVLNALQCFSFSAQLQEGFTFEIEQILLAHRRLMRQCAAGEDVRERASDDGVVIADTTGAAREVDA